MQLIIHGIKADGEARHLTHRAAADDYETARAVAAVYLDRGLAVRIWQAKHDAMAPVLLEELEPAR